MKDRGGCQGAGASGHDSPWHLTFTPRGWPCSSRRLLSEPSLRSLNQGLSVLGGGRLSAPHQDFQESRREGRQPDVDPWGGREVPGGRWPPWRLGGVPVKAHQPTGGLSQGSREAVKAGRGPGPRGRVQQLEGGPVAGEADCRGETGSAVRTHHPSPTPPCPGHHRTPALRPPRWLRLCLGWTEPALTRCPGPPLHCACCLAS